MRQFAFISLSLILSPVFDGKAASSNALAEAKHIMPNYSDETIDVPPSRPSRSTYDETCAFKLRHLNYEGLELIGEDATVVYTAIQNMRAPLPATIKIGIRHSRRSPHTIDFSHATREDIDRFLNQLQNLPSKWRPAPTNFVFDVYKSAGLVFDGSESQEIGSALLRSESPHVSLYVNGNVSMRVDRGSDGAMAYNLDLTRAGAQEVSVFIKIVSNRMASGSDNFERTKKFGIPLLRRSAPVAHHEFGM